MLVYLTYILSLFFGFISDRFGSLKSIDRFLLFVPVFLLLLIPLSIRHETVGTDTQAYYNLFGAIFHYYDSFEVLRHEPLYVFLNYFVGVGGGGPSHLIFVCSIISLYPLFFLAYKYKVSVVVFVAILCGSGIYSFMFNGVRQAIAMGLVVFSVYFVLKRNVTVFTALIFLATFFHYSAISAVFIYFLAVIRIPALLVFFVWLISIYNMLIGDVVLFLLKPVMSYMPVVFVSYFEGGVEDKSLALGSIKDQLVFLFLFYVFCKKDRIFIDRIGEVLICICMFGIILSNFFSGLGYASRVALYFTMFLCIAIPYLSPYVFGRLNSKLFMILVSIVYSYLHFKNLSIGSHGVIPYATIFS